LISEQPFSWTLPLAACNPFCPRSSTEIRFLPGRRAKQDAKSTAFPSIPVAFCACLGIKDKSGSFATIDAEIKKLFRKTVETIGGPEPARKLASWGECRYCDVSRTDCPERIEIV
jgi:hypothetical protein